MQNWSILPRTEGLVVFRGLLDNPVVEALHKALCSADDGDGHVARRDVAIFESMLFDHGTNWTSYLLEAVLECPNPYVIDYVAALREGRPVNALLQTIARDELTFLSDLGALTLELVETTMPYDQYGTFELLHPWEVTPDVDFAAEYDKRLAQIQTRGYGQFARYDVFTVESGQLVPVKHPDVQTLASLPGYEQEREKVISNTEALLSGLPASNILLYGDAGTGKSSAIKAIAAEYAPQGLRLVEVKKSQLYELPEIMDELAANPLKFIIFIDDLSFTSDDTDFAALKAILEGSVCGRSSNIVVYATSNRRHLIKETMEDRQGTDIHESDTRQELMSLSARFGLVVTFMQPDKKRFAQILQELLKQEGVEGDFDELLQRAEALALRAGGRSPRVARQFVDLIKAGVQV